MGQNAKWCSRKPRPISAETLSNYHSIYRALKFICGKFHLNPARTVDLVYNISGVFLSVMTSFLQSWIPHQFIDTESICFLLCCLYFCLSRSRFSILTCCSYFGILSPRSRLSYNKFAHDVRPHYPPNVLLRNIKKNDSCYSCSLITNHAIFWIRTA